MIHTEEYRKYAFFGLLVFLLYLFYLMISPYLTYAILGIIVAIGTHPLHTRAKTRFKHESHAALFSILIIILIIIVPGIIITSALVKETIGFLNHMDLTEFTLASEKISELLGNKVDIAPQIANFVSGISQSAVNSTWSIIGSVTDTAIGLLIMFTIMYYCFIDGPTWIERLSSFAPFNSKRKVMLVQKIKSVTKTVIYVEILISIIQGIVGGIGFYLVGIPNPIFWGFIMALLAFLPFVGTGLIWIPAALIKIINNEIVWGIFLIVYGISMIGGIDYYLRQKMISGASRIHPLTAILGAFGGLKLLGFSGLIIGPLIAALLEAVILFHYEDAVNHKKKNK